MTEKKVKRKLIALSIALVFVTALGVFLCIWFFGARYSVFDDAAEKVVSLPDLSDGFCPQGTCALPENGGYTVAVSGYYKKGVPSRVYLLGDGEPKYVTVTKDGKELDAHFGGVAATGEYLYITNDSEMVRVSLEKVYAAAESGGKVEIVDAFEVGVPQIAFCSVYDDLLLVGEFYRAGKMYGTEESHHIEKNGETNYAFVYCYKFSDSEKGGIESKPYAVLSVRGLVQGIAVTDDYIVLSCSWGLADSKLYCYPNPLAAAAASAETDMFFLGKDNLMGTLTAPCMSEGIFEKDGNICILFESGSNKYKNFVRRQTKAIYRVPLGVFEK